MSEKTIRSFWDKKAKENPYWYVSSYCDYDSQRNMADFWASGLQIWADLERELNYSPKPTDIVVEIGCGVGRLTRAIAPDVGHVEAFDISEEMLRIAKAGSIQNAIFRLAEGFNLASLKDSSADLVLAYCVFQHLPSLAALQDYVLDMVRVAKPGAIVAFTLTARDWRTSLMPLFRVKAYLRELVSRSGPKGLYRKEWTGIRPSERSVRQISPIRLTRMTMHGDKWLFFGVARREGAT
jgi:SAM-dependent methyltransferase